VKKAVKSTNYCEYTERIITTEDGVQMGDEVRFTNQGQKIIGHPLDSFIKARERYVKCETCTSSARLKTLSTAVESYSDSQ
jgi:hypothetical protein